MSFVVINAVTVAEDGRADFEERFARRAGKVSGSPGFEAFELLKSLGGDRYLVYTRWATEDDFKAWAQSRAVLRRARAARRPRADGRRERGLALRGARVGVRRAVDEAHPRRRHRHRRRDRDHARGARPAARARRGDDRRPATRPSSTRPRTPSACSITSASRLPSTAAPPGRILPSTAVRDQAGAEPARSTATTSTLPPARSQAQQHGRRAFLVVGLRRGLRHRARPDRAADERRDRAAPRPRPRAADPAARADGRQPRPRERHVVRPSSTSGPTPRRRGSCCAAASAT